jgi:hypothetical protein
MRLSFHRLGRLMFPKLMQSHFAISTPEVCKLPPDKPRTLSTFYLHDIISRDILVLQNISAVLSGLYEISWSYFLK